MVTIRWWLDSRDVRHIGKYFSESIVFKNLIDINVAKNNVRHLLATNLKLGNTSCKTEEGEVLIIRNVLFAAELLKNLHSYTSNLLKFYKEFIRTYAELLHRYQKMVTNEYISFIDEFSHFTPTCTMKSKCDV